MNFELLKKNRGIILVVFFAATNLVLAIILLSLLVRSRQDPDFSTTAGYQEIEQLNGSNWDFQQLTIFFKDLASSKGGEYAYRALAMAGNKNYLTSNVDSHLLGHVVGDILFKQRAIEGIKVCTDDLRNACSHSIVVGALLEKGPEELPKIVAVCKEAPGGKGAYTMCVHGLGHGVLAYSDYDMRKAAVLCDKTGTEDFHYSEVPQCIGGVTMEMMAGVHDKVAWSKQAPNYFKENDPLAPCDQGFIPANALSFCYIYLTPHLFEAAGIDLGFPDPLKFGKAMSFCLKLSKTDSNRSICLASFGKEFVVLANNRNVQSVENMANEQLRKVYDWCKLGPSEGLQPCVDSALQSLFWGGENDRNVSIRFCSTITDGKPSKDCFNSLISAVSYFIADSSYKSSFCSEVPVEYQTGCKKILLNET